MRITDVKIRQIFNEAKLCALASVTLDDELAVHDIRVVRGKERLFVSMPSRKDDKGKFRDVVHPINFEARQKLEEAVLAAYRDAVNHEKS